MTNEIKAFLQEILDKIQKFEEKTQEIVGAEIIIKDKTYIFDGEKFVISKTIKEQITTIGGVNTFSFNAVYKEDEIILNDDHIHTNKPQALRNVLKTLIETYGCEQYIHMNSNVVLNENYFFKNDEQFFNHLKNVFEEVKNDIQFRPEKLDFSIDECNILSSFCDLIKESQNSKPITLIFQY